MAGQRTAGTKVGDFCAQCGVRNQAVCAPLDIDELAVVESFRSGVRAVPAGVELFAQGEVNPRVYTLLEGWAMLYETLEDGRRQIMEFCLPGAFLGFQVDPERPIAYTAQAITDIRVCTFPRRGLEELFHEKPDMSFRMACIATREQNFAFQHLTSVGRRTAQERVANLLLELFLRVRLTSPDGAGHAIRLPLTQEHIGDALGLTSVHVNRTLRALREDGILTVRDGVLRIMDADRLVEIAGYDPEVHEPRT